MVVTIKGTFLAGKSGTNRESGVKWSATDLYSGGELVTVRGYLPDNSAKSMQTVLEIPNVRVSAYNGKIYCTYIGNE